MIKEKDMVFTFIPRLISALIQILTCWIKLRLPLDLSFDSLFLFDHGLVVLFKLRLRLVAPLISMVYINIRHQQPWLAGWVVRLMQEAFSRPRSSASSIHAINRLRQVKRHSSTCRHWSIRSSSQVAVRFQVLKIQLRPSTSLPMLLCLSRVPS